MDCAWYHVMLYIIFYNLKKKRREFKYHFYWRTVFRISKARRSCDWPHSHPTDVDPVFSAVWSTVFAGSRLWSQWRAAMSLEAYFLNMSNALVSTFKQLLDSWTDAVYHTLYHTVYHAINTVYHTLYHTVFHAINTVRTIQLLRWEQAHEDRHGGG